MQDKNTDNSNTVTYEDAILETLTLPEELKNWCKSHPEFLEALKVIASTRFLHLGAVVHYPKDKVLGIYTYDYQIKNPKFKQDYIEYSDITNPTFILYTAYVRSHGGPSKWVKDIKEFFKKIRGYDKGAGSHHLTFEELLSIEGLTPILVERARWAIKKGEELKKTGVRKLTDQELREWLDEVKRVKQKEKWYVHAPLESTK